MTASLEQDRIELLLVGIGGGRPDAKSKRLMRLALLQRPAHQQTVTLHR